MARMPAIAALLALSVAEGLPAAVPQENPQAPKAPEEVHVVQKGDLTPVFELDGTFDATESVEFKLRMESYQGEFMLVRVAAPGESVRKGDVVFALDRAPIEKLIAAAENDHRQACATLEKAEAEIRLGAKADALALLQSQTALKDAETNLKVFDEVEGRQMLLRADLSVKYSEDGVSDQTEELDQLEKMYKSEELTNATAEIVVRRARRSLERSKVYLQMAREEAGVTKQIKFPQQRQTFVFALESAKRALEGLKAAQALSKVQRETELVRAKAAAVQQEEQLAKLRRDHEAFVLRAPFDGHVFYGQFQQNMWATAEQVAPMLKPGEKLQPGQILLTLCGVRVRLRADLPEADYFEITPDQPAAVAPISMPDRKLEGRVRTKSLASAARPAGPAFEARIELQDPPAELVPGMKAKATIKGKTLEGVLRVPSKAVSTEGTKHTVKVPTPQAGVSEAREVTVGKSDGKMTHVKSGLEAGDKVVVPK